MTEVSHTSMRTHYERVCDERDKWKAIAERYVAFVAKFLPAAHENWYLQRDYYKLLDETNEDDVKDE